MKDYFNWPLIAITATGITILYLLTPAKIDKHKPTFFGAGTIILGVVAGLGAANMWLKSLYIEEDCMCTTVKGETFKIAKDILLLGCLAIFGISLVEVIDKFKKKLASK